VGPRIEKSIWALDLKLKRLKQKYDHNGLRVSIGIRKAILFTKHQNSSSSFSHERKSHSLFHGLKKKINFD